MKAAQTGATEAGNNFIGFIIHQAPGPILAVQPTVELAKRNSQQRIDPLIEDSAELRKIVAPARSRDSGNTVLAKRFPGGQLVLTGANSATGLRSMPARYVFLDEVDAYPGDVDGEGDPIALAEARTATFGHRKKLFLVSTPTIKGLSRIEREYEASDQRRYFVPCPHCASMQWLQFERLRWDKGRPETAAYMCESCEAPITEAAKTDMLAKGEWRPTTEGSNPRTRGYHLSGLYSPVGWTSWADIARSWDEAQHNDAALKTAKNVLLGETWMESGEAPDWQRLYDRREQWNAGTVPERGLFLTAGADVQKDRIEVDVWAWGRGLESWLIDHVVIEGGPSDPACWLKLTRLLSQTWGHASGKHMTIARLAIDTGFETSAVYGHTSAAGAPDVREGLRISAKEAEEILRRDLTGFETAMAGLVKKEITQAQFDVLVSFAYNCGVGALKASTLLKRVNAGAFDAVPGELMKWTKAKGKELPGLVRRRRAEAALWRGLPKTVDAQQARTAPDLPLPPKTITQSREANAAILAGGAGAIAAASEAMPLVREGASIVPILVESLGRPAFIAALIIVAAAIAIWVWRRQRLLEQGA
jgi:GH24 family phage-related lysozyme (muramidase)